MELRETAILQKILDLDKVANINLCDNSGRSALHWFVMYNLPDMVVWLVEHGAKINMTDTFGNTALHYASRVKNGVVITQLILEKGISVNSQNKEGGTPILQAAVNNNSDTVKFLIGKGADLDILATNGEHPWHYASMYGANEVMHLLVSKIPNVDLKTANAEQYTALWLASQQGHFQIVKWLAGLGADVNIARHSDGTTALQTAIVKNHLPVIKVLVEECKADINKTNLDGASPLYYSLGLLASSL